MSSSQNSLFDIEVIITMENNFFQMRYHFWIISMLEGCGRLTYKPYFKHKREEL
jgi:hypothetical protein